jgi:F-type H+-transporting ATPase subunit b
MPQIAQLAETYASQLVWLLVFFGLVYFVVGRGIVPQVMATVDRRDTQIADDLTAARAARDQADAREAEWRQRENANRERARGLIASAKAQAGAENEAKLAQAQAGIDARLTAAEADIVNARRSALTEIELVAADATQDIVARLTGQAIAPDVARGAVKEALQHG